MQYLVTVQDAIPTDFAIQFFKEINFVKKIEITKEANAPEIMDSTFENMAELENYFGFRKDNKLSLTDIRRKAWKNINNF